MHKLYLFDYKSFIVLLIFVSILIPFSNVNAITNTQSMDFERSSNEYLYITDANQTGLNLSGDFTLEAWIKPEQLPNVAGGDFGIASKYLSAGNQRGWSVYIPENTDGGQVANRLEIGVSPDGTTANFDALTTSDPIITSEDVGHWVHIAVAYDISARSIDVYKNGEQVDTTYRAKNGSVPYIFDNSEPVEIGRFNQNASAAFDGQIDEVRIWDDIRTSAEVTDYMMESLVGTESNLVGYWSLNATTTDATTNGNNLIKGGSPVFSEEPAHNISCVMGTPIFNVWNFTGSFNCNVNIF